MRQSPHQIKHELEEFGLAPSDDELEAMLQLIEQPMPHLIIWAYTGAKRHSQYFDIDEITCSQEEFNMLLDRAGLEVREDPSREGKRINLQQKGWPSHDEAYEQTQELRELEGLSGDYPLGLWLDIPECCAYAFAKNDFEAEMRFFNDHPFEGCTSEKEWYAMKRKEAGNPSDGEWGRLEEALFKQLIDYYHTHRYFEDYGGGGWNTERAPTSDAIQSGDLPKYLHLMLFNFIPCTPDCEAYRAQSERMYRSLVIFFGEERADDILEQHSW